MEKVSEDTRKDNMCHFLNMAASAATDVFRQISQFRLQKYMNVQSRALEEITKQSLELDLEEKVIEAPQFVQDFKQEASVSPKTPASSVILDANLDAIKPSRRI